MGGEGLGGGVAGSVERWVWWAGRLGSTSVFADGWSGHCSAWRLPQGTLGNLCGARPDVSDGYRLNLSRLERERGGEREHKEDRTESDCMEKCTKLHFCGLAHSATLITRVALPWLSSHPACVSAAGSQCRALGSRENTVSTSVSIIAVAWPLQTG